MPNRHYSKIGLRSRSIRRLAEFFDSTSTQKMDWEDADIQFKRPEMVQVSLRIPKDDLQTIREAARKAGIGHTTYMRMIIHEVVNSENQPRGKTRSNR